MRFPTNAMVGCFFFVITLISKLKKHLLFNCIYFFKVFDSFNWKNIFYLVWC